MTVSIFKDLFKSKDVPYIVPIEKVIARIKDGASRETIERIREAKTKELKDALKKTLPSILFAGEFSERNSKALVKHSGLMVIDFDKFQDENTMSQTRDLLKKNDHVFLVFTSPSGDGLKAVVKIPSTADRQTHPKFFKAFQKEFSYDFFDISNSNVDRVCFESYDADIYVNENSVAFSPELIDEGHTIVERVPVIQLTDEDKIISKIMSFNWKKDFIEGQRNNFIFDVAGAFCEYGIRAETAEGYISNNIVFGDFTDGEVSNIVKSVYKRRAFGSKYFEDYEKISRIKRDIHKGRERVKEKHGITDSIFDDIKEEIEHDDFWTIEEKNGKNKITIDSLKYKLFLERNGFRKYFPHNAQKPIWVSVVSNKVSETSVEKIKDFVLGYLLERNEIAVWSYCASFQALFSENYLLMLSTIEMTMLRDEKSKSYIAFNNGIVEVTKDAVNLVDYIDINGYVWQSQIIQRDFVKTSKTSNDYKVFIKNISNGEPLSIESMIGYLLSTYKNKMNNKAVILNDEVITDNPEGGTGKGLFIQGIRQIRNVSILDGKTFDSKKSFPYQTVSTETQVLVFDDVKKNFDFESQFSLVTEGITLERKNKDAIKLRVEDSPKMVISTNYAIKGEGNSHDRRRFEVEIAQYYGKARTPYDEFGRELFDDWTKDDFIAFDNYMISCIQTYLTHGLVEQNAKNIRMRKFIAETSMEFYEWVQDASNFPLNTRNDKHTFFNNFTEEYQDFKKWLTRKKFNIWIQKYATFARLEYTDGNTNGLRWFMIMDKNFDENEDAVPF